MSEAGERPPRARRKGAGRRARGAGGARHSRGRARRGRGGTAPSALRTCGPGWQQVWFHGLSLLGLALLTAAPPDALVDGRRELRLHHRLCHHHPRPPAAVHREYADRRAAPAGAPRSRDVLVAVAVFWNIATPTCRTTPSCMGSSCSLTCSVPGVESALRYSAARDAGYSCADALRGILSAAGSSRSWPCCCPAHAPPVSS